MKLRKPNVYINTSPVLLLYLETDTTRSRVK